MKMANGGPPLLPQQPQPPPVVPQVQPDDQQPVVSPVQPVVPPVHPAQPGPVLSLHWSHLNQNLQENQMKMHKHIY